MKRSVSILLILCMISTFCIPASGTESMQYQYATHANSGTQDEICTTLNGTGAAKYYAGEYSYQQLSQLTGENLLYTLRRLMGNTHTTKLEYDVDLYHLLIQTDCQKENTANVTLFFTGHCAGAADQITANPDGWNRGAIWPAPLGGYTSSDAGSDLHQLRAVDQQINYIREILKYGAVTSGEIATATIADNLSGGTYNRAYFEPNDNIKGDIARTILYVYVRYGETYPKCANITNVFTNIDTLLQWCADDPVDTWEMGRNEVVAAIQGNRNVFVDYPELAWLLFEKAIPTTLTTPSGMAKTKMNTPTCSHKNTVIRNAAAPSCTQNGNSGDLYCSDCGILLQTGTKIPATGHQNTVITNEVSATCYEKGYSGDVVCVDCEEILIWGHKIAASAHKNTCIKNAIDATCTQDGYTGDTYCADCGIILSHGETAKATGHNFSSPTEKDGITRRTCKNCKYSEILSDNSITETDVTEATDLSTEAGDAPDTVASQTKKQDISADSIEKADSSINGTPWLILCIIGLVLSFALLFTYLIINNRKS